MYLKDRTKAHIERVVGKPFSQISKMELDEEIQYSMAPASAGVFYTRKSAPTKHKQEPSENGKLLPAPDNFG